ncbi:MAG: PQQ-dependent sugar dehydrogenase [Verrucomicrobiota bacterium]
MRPLPIKNPKRHVFSLGKNSVIAPLLCAAALSLATQAQTVNVDWGKNAGASVLYSGAAAIGSAGDTWNTTDSELNDFSDLQNLLDTSGSPTTFDVTWSDELQSSVNTGAIEFGSSGHNALMEDYAFTNTDVATITISDLPLNADYTLYLFGVPDGASQGTRFAVTNSTEGTQDVTVGNIADDNGLATPEDYVIFTGSTGAGGSIVYTQTSFAGGFSGSNGFQLDVAAGGGPPPTPAAPVLSSPSNSASDVAVSSTTLDWNTAADAAEYNVFLWKTSESMPGTPTATTSSLSYDPGTLDYSTNYSWMVQSSNVTGTANSPTWTFTTESAPPPSTGGITYVNVDWGKNASASILYSGAAAIGSVGDLWNTTDSELNNFSDLENLLDTSGAATTIDVTWTDELQSSVNTGAIEFGSTGHNALMEDYAFTDTNPATITISELPTNADYTLYLYGVPDSNGQETTFAVTGSNESAQAVTIGNIADNNGLNNPDDYVIFTGNTGTGGTIVYTQSSSAGGFSGSNGFQLELGSEPTGNDDFDGDGLLDVWEYQYGLVYLPPDGAIGDNGAAGDPDGDSLSNIEEQTNGTNPIVADTDGDGVYDGAEVNTHGTSPTDSDSDDDGSPDGEEVFFGTDPDDDQSFPNVGDTVAGLSSAGSVGPFLDGSLPAKTPNTPSGENWGTEIAFPNVSFGETMGIVSEPRSDYLHIIERGGNLVRIDTSDPTTSTKETVLSIPGVNTAANGGLRSVVFHPDFNDSGSPNEHYVYCFYTTSAAGSDFTQQDGAFFNRLSRFTLDPTDGIPNQNTELVMMQQRSIEVGQHFGGGLTFDLDGFLMVSWGDLEFLEEDLGHDMYQDAQRIDRIFQSAVLRLDVDNQGGSVSHAPTRTLQGATGPNGIVGTSQSCPIGHHYYHADNFSGQGYSIPSDNYFVLNPPAPGTAFTNTPLHGATLEEHHALGVRNPWRMTTDPVSGDVVLFSVGSNQGGSFGNAGKFEQVELVTPGANLGWAYREGLLLKDFETGRTTPPSQYAPTFLGVETDPLAFWDHNVGNAATGGTFYHGTQWPSLDGQLVFADTWTQKIWAMDYTGDGAPSSTRATTDGVSIPNNYSVRLLAQTGLWVRQMAVGPSGEEIYISDGGSVIYRLVNSSAASVEPPALLSQTGAFTGNVADLNPRAGLIPYQPASQLWSDRAEKLRWIAVPNDEGTAGQYDDDGQKILYSENGEWAFPVGTVFIKHFALPTDLRDPDNPALLKPVETRFLVRGEDGIYYFFTYQWRADGSDADLLLSGATADYSIIDAQGSSFTQTWTYPTRLECVECHQSGAGHVLGMKSRQMNHPIAYPSSGNNANQVTTFSSLGMFDQGPDFGSLSTLLTSAAIDDSSATVEHRVHSYLDSNCSFCHRPEAEGGRAEFDVRLVTPLDMAGLIDVTPKAGNLGVFGATLVKPGNPDESILYLRDSTVGPNQMPPIARSVNDPDYVPLLRAWIESYGYDGFNAWADAAGIEGGLTGDDDGDHHENVFEFVFRQDGKDADLSGMPNLVIPGGGQPEISIPISGAALSDGFGVVVEGSVDLVNWYPTGNPLSGLQVVSDTSSPGTDGVQTVRVISGSSQHFIRYGVIIP